MIKKSTIKYLFAFLASFLLGSFSLCEASDFTGTINVVDSITNVKCNGGNDGSINLSVSGANAPFTFLWSTNETTEDVSNLSAGTYSCTVFDAIGDSVNLSFQITAPAPIKIGRAHV